jgi:polar amino acid transport system ATP-binding protein
MTAETAIRVRNVRKYFGRREVLKGIDLSVSEGEVLCLIGPSGSGKSTLLRCINLLEDYQHGEIKVFGTLMGYRTDDRRQVLYKLTDTERSAQRAGIGMVFQKFNLFSHRTALQNVIEAPTRVAKVPREAATAEALSLLTRVGLGDRGDAYPSELSSGQQQRVAIARALAMHPRIMLFDEPTSALDPEMVGEVLAVMRDLAGEGMTMVVVTHEIGFAREAADSIAFLEDGRILQQGPPDDLFGADAHPRARSFLETVL